MEDPYDSSFRNPEDLQRKLYFLVEQLQNMAREIPPKYQQRVPYELLSGLANSLLNDTVFEIVKGLMDIQHVSEKHLFQQRLQIINKQRRLPTACDIHRAFFLAVEIQDLLANNSAEMQCSLLETVKKRHADELRVADMKIVMQLDQKVSDQQVTLEKAGVPGFYVTNNPLEVKVQMHLLDFIIRLSRMKLPQ